MLISSDPIELLLQDSYSSLRRKSVYNRDKPPRTRIIVRSHFWKGKISSLKNIELSDLTNRESFFLGFLNTLFYKILIIKILNLGSFFI